MYKFSPSLYLVSFSILFGALLFRRGNNSRSWVIFQLFELFVAFPIYFSSGATEGRIWDFAVGQWVSHAAILSADYSKISAIHE